MESEKEESGEWRMKNREVKSEELKLFGVYCSWFFEIPLRLLRKIFAPFAVKNEEDKQESWDKNQASRVKKKHSCIRGQKSEP